LQQGDGPCFARFGHGDIDVISSQFVVAESALSRCAVLGLRASLRVFRVFFCLSLESAAFFIVLKVVVFRYLIPEA